MPSFRRSLKVCRTSCWRVAFAFDPQRHAVLLVGGDKGGADQRRFYKRLLSVADTRYDEHLNVKGV
jgi:hypothetical protein